MEPALKAIAEPHRRQILLLVSDRERAAGDIAAHFDVTHAAVSQHLRVLKEAGLVRERRDGRRRLYTARRESIGRLRAELDSFWTQALTRLKHEAEAEQRRKDGRDG